ncbi:MAG: phospholipase D-like domain-containing protein [Burkholderiaceae bacterium]
MRRSVLVFLAGTLAVVAVGLASCASLPEINPDLAQPSRQVVLEGPGRPLTPAQSKAILGKLAQGGKETSIFERHLALEEAIAGSPLTVGNRAVLLQDGPAAYKAMLTAIRGARDHINFETYIFEDDEVGRAFADELVAKQKQGVQVNLIYDSVGSIGTERAFFERIAEAGSAVLEYNPVNPLHAREGWNVNERDHRKLLVVDGTIAFLGGINISSVYSSKPGSGGSSPGGSSGRTRSDERTAKDLPWRDTQLQLEGPVVAELQKLFFHTWDRQKGEPLPARKYYPPGARKGNDVVRAIGSAPSDPYSLIYATLISAISSAETEVWIANAYFVPDPQLLEALKDAAQRGVDVRLLLPSKTDFWLVLHAGQAAYDDLLAAGVKIFERREALLHAKTAVIDGVWSTVGSTNLDWRSFLHNQELNAVVLGQDFGGQMRNVFARDLAASEQITLEGWRRRGLEQRAKELLGKMWAYWL